MAPVLTTKGKLMKMYGLFSYSYDHYEWENLVCVSESQKKLIDRVYETTKGDILLVHTEDTHSELADEGTFHLMIKEIEVI